MLITELKAKETILSQATGKVFLIICHGCKEVSFPEHAAEELKKELELTGSVTTDYICSRENLDIRLGLEKYASAIEAADTILVFSCGVGVQTVADKLLKRL